MIAFSKFGLVIALVSFTLVHSERASATNVKDLKKECSGVYRVLSSKAYYTPPPTHPTRALPRAYAGTTEKIKIVSLSGADCETFKTSFKLGIAVGLELDYGTSTGEDFAAAQKSAADRLGQTFPFQVNQNFGYQDPGGELPFFPTVHSESADALGLYGKADAKALYGTLAPSAIDDDLKLQLVDELASKISWGTAFPEYATSNQWLSLTLELQPVQKQTAALDYGSTLALLFHNMTASRSTLWTTSIANQTGAKLCALLNYYGGTKWQTKLQVLEHNPMLLNDQFVFWGATSIAGGDVLYLSAAESEQFLEDTLVTSKDLAKVQLQVPQARILLGQYQQAANTLLQHDSKTTKWIGHKYDLTAHSLDLITQITAIQ